MQSVLKVRGSRVEGLFLGVVLSLVAFALFNDRLPGKAPARALQASQTHAIEADYVDKSKWWCGGYDPLKLNDFGPNRTVMEQHGWIFSKRDGNWATTTSFRPELTGVCAPDPAKGNPDCIKASRPTVYWGWDFPGNGIIRLPLHGHGKLTLDVGNLYYMGFVVVSFEGWGKLAMVGGKTATQTVESHFSHGWNLIINEEQPRAIMAINSIDFKCAPRSPRLAPGNLRAHVGDIQYVNGAAWRLRDIEGNCSEYCVISSEDAIRWGSDKAVISRQFCATSTMFQDAEGFLYPDTGDWNTNVTKNTLACHVITTQCPTSTKRGICELNLGKYAVHLLEDRHPTHYPPMVAQNEA